jgi:cytochrome b561
VSASDPGVVTRDVRGGGAHYTRTAIALHWTMALLIVGNWALGWTMADLPFSPSRIRLFNYHKWIGVTILALAAARLAWRLFHAAPELPGGIARWQQVAAHVAHGLLYALFFAVPLSGWAYSSAAGFPLVYLGLIPLPDWVPVEKALAENLVIVHATFAYSLAVVAVLHVAGAVQHAVAQPTTYLRRMTSPKP